MNGKKMYSKSQAILTLLYSTKKTKVKHIIYSKYIYYLRKSAYMGNSEAQFELGLQYEDVYFFGPNFNANINKCEYWYRKACKAGVSEACNNLAVLLENKKDLKEARKYYKKAIQLGNKSAIKNLKTD